MPLFRYVPLCLHFIIMRSNLNNKKYNKQKYINDIYKSKHIQYCRSKAAKYDEAAPQNHNILI